MGPDTNHSFHSCLTRNATVHWRQAIYDTSAQKNETSVDLFLDFKEVDWTFAQKIYGWSAFQYQAWAKGQIINHDAIDHTVNLFTDNILELWVNNEHIFGGDFFDFHRAPVVVEVHPGRNNVSIRLVREVRAMGGSYPPITQACLRLALVTKTLDVVSESLVLPDVVEGRFCSEYGSVVVRNQGHSWLSVRKFLAVSDEDVVGTMHQEVLLAPGQARPLKMQFSVDYRLGQSLKFVLEYSGNETGVRESVFSSRLKHADMIDLHKITFLHRSGVVSYAILKPPHLPTSSNQSEFQVLLNLHGAGVEVNDSLVQHMFDGAQNLSAWIISPTGMSSWSSDDWHTWGFADAQSAVDAIPAWIRTTGWKGPGCRTTPLLVAGHSNGGQGTWYFATHQPDRLLGAIAASGYSSIENYVPYVMWNQADALQDAVLYASRISFRHERLLENLQAVPVFQQHGLADNNVPAYHSRLMNSLLAQAGHLVEYSELPGKGHWFDGTMTTKLMMDFYAQHLNLPCRERTIPTNFTFIIPNSGDMGSKFGLVVDQLSTSDRLGRIKVTSSVHESLTRWQLRTENVHRFHFDLKDHFDNPPHDFTIDDLAHSFSVGAAQASFVKTDGGIWSLEVARDWKTLDQRYGRQRGPVDAILRSVGPFEIVHNNDTLSIAVQASRNFLQYFGADSNLIPITAYEEALERSGNVVVICLGASVPDPRLARHPVRVTNKRIILEMRDQRTTSIPLTAGMGGVWLRPLPKERLELVVWGYDRSGLRQAARLIPTITGAGVPDFVILSDSARWKGHAGAVAMGFFDYEWKISPASYLP